MIGITVITHGKFADGLKQSVEMISGTHDQFEVIGLQESQEVEDFKNNVWEILKNINSGEGVLVFVDMFGATPFNTVSSLRNDLLSSKINLNLVTGVNLPALLEALTTRNMKSLQELTNDVLTSARESIESLVVTESE